MFKRIPCNSFTTKWLNKSCFVKGTLVHTKKGLKKIEEIKAGDEVLSYNQDTKQIEYKSVVETYVRQTEEIIKLNVEGEAKAIETTPEHPFYVRVHRARDSIGDDGDWRDADGLQVNDEVLSASGQWQKIVNVERQGKSETVYNFAVEDNQNYFVGQEGILVHNSCKPAVLDTDILTKGMHVHVDDIVEVALKPGIGGEIIYKPANALARDNNALFKKAVDEVKDNLANNPAFQQKLLQVTKAARDTFSGNPNSRYNGLGAQLNFLVKALNKIGIQ